MAATPSTGPAPPSHQPAALVAAAASVAAGLIHAAAAVSHDGLSTLSLLFAVTAVAQIGWGAALLARPARAVLLAGVGISSVAVAAWLASRSAGLPAIEGLEGAQAVGFQDGLAAGLAALALAGAALALASVTLPRPARAVAPALIALIAVATVPAMAQPHEHGSHDHGEPAVDAEASDDEHRAEAPEHDH